MEREKLIKILSEICPGVDFNTEEALIDDEIIDSIDIVGIVGEIVSEFEVEIDVDDLLPDNFNSVDAMVELIRRKRS